MPWLQPLTGETQQSPVLSVTNSPGTRYQFSLTALRLRCLTLYVSSMRSESRILPPLSASSTRSEFPAVVANSRPATGGNRAMVLHVSRGHEYSIASVAGLGLGLGSFTHPHI